MDEVMVLHRARLPGADDPVDVVVGDGRMVGLRPVGDLATTSVQTVDLDGRVVVPGLWDTHVHVTQWALARRQLDLVSARSAAEAARRIGSALDAREPVVRADLLAARRMRSATWPDRPHRDLLDRFTGTTPVVLQNIDLHTVWCNSAALARFDRPDHPTGVLREDECYRVITALGDDTTTAVQDVAVADALADASRRGIVGVKDYEFGDAVAHWQRRTTRSRPPVRVDTTVYRSHLDDAIARGWATGVVVPDTHGMVRAGHLKVFVDGALNSGTALCHEPADATDPLEDPAAHGRDPAQATAADADGRGHLATTPDDLRDVLARAWAHGIAPAVHAIGDLAVTIALDAFDHVGCPGRIEHAQLVTDDDLARFDRPGLVASVQPAHCTDDRDVTDARWADRAHRAYRYADLLAAGARLEFGSDAPVSPLDPWAAIAAAVTRTDDDRPPWHPDQCLDVRDALAASARGRTDVRAGDPADLAVLDDDPLGIDAAHLATMPVAATMVAGRWTHGPA